MTRVFLRFIAKNFGRHLVLQQTAASREFSFLRQGFVHFGLDPEVIAVENILCIGY